MSSSDTGPPEATEWHIGSLGTTVRGLIWRGEKLPVLVIHGSGPDHDLDRWRSLPEHVHRAGHTVIVFDLPGHGLSDGEASEEDARIAIGQIMRDTDSTFGPGIAVITEESGNRLLPPDPLKAIVVLSPRDSTGAQTGSPKLIFCGATDPAAHHAADAYLRASRGWTLVSSFATSEQGASLLETAHAPKVAAQIVSFLRDYR